ncbi:uncharacterized protein LOC133518337 [Cydia pomonella]|uniref:uncharacterized protein LOC133518337 n=1 Tax=Cydia pomonella TaxID=82600 RepID=UPI002ADE8833|nr:uncharacterized protein LOC133518337 [Cydia pomonella]
MITCCCMLLLLVTLVTGASSDCDACVAGRCHFRKPIFTGFPVTDQLAIDRTENILYLQLYENQNIAIFLDDLQIRLVNVMRTSGRAFDQQSRVLYLGTKEVNDTFYKYDIVSNKTEAISIEDHDRKPDFMFYGYNRLHFIDKNRHSMYFYNTAENSVYHYNMLVNNSISHFVFSGKNLLIVSNETLYYYDIDDDGVTEIRNGNYVLSVDKNDNVYLGNSTDRTIYKRDSSTGALDLYAYYNSGLIEDFVFEKNDHVVFREADGSVAQWVPTFPQKLCSVEPPHSGYFIRQMENVDDSCIN